MNYIQDPTSRVNGIVYTFLMVGFSGQMVREASPWEVSQTWPVPEPGTWILEPGQCLNLEPGTWPVPEPELFPSMHFQMSPQSAWQVQF